MRLFQKFVEQAEFVHQLQRRWMNSIPAEIAKEIGMFFQNDYGHARPGKQIPSHHPGRAAANDHAASLHFISHRRRNHITNRGLRKLVRCSQEVSTDYTDRRRFTEGRSGSRKSLETFSKKIC